MSNKHTLFFFILLFVYYESNCQDCSHNISGYVHDADTHEPLQAVNLFISEVGKGVTTDSLGFFTLQEICSGEFHLVLSHIGCASEQLFLQIAGDTILHLHLSHSASTLEGVTVTASSHLDETQNARSIHSRSIRDMASKSFSDILESVNGVRSLKKGTGISKPIVHGLYGNRLTILNNGIAQGGQQWGNDHAPEIDPLVAQQITVIKGASILEYLGSNRGAIVLVEPGNITPEPHLHGNVNSFFESNGLHHGISTQLQQFSGKLGWKFSGSWKMGGDRKTADYFLNNTGNQEASFAVQLERPFSEKWKTDLYISSFHTSLGVLRGSHIGNTNDLRDALTREEPFFTENRFSYVIEAPQQKVQHHLIKMDVQNWLDDDKLLKLTLAGQLNRRKEFDVRRGGRTNIPALHLKKNSFYSELKYEVGNEENWQWSTGIQSNIEDNTNDPETGILPLIPDYNSFLQALYLSSEKKIGRSRLEWGGRMDHLLRDVATISSSIPREIVRYRDQFFNVSSSIGWQYLFNDRYSMTVNSAYLSRSPDINELYSSGLHQGVSGIEEGSTDLRIEQSWKSSLGFLGRIGKQGQIESLIYFQNIQDFIYLQPQDELRPTIRGAFPVFKYQQTDARISGVDISGKYRISESQEIMLSGNFIRAWDKSNDIYLINFPSNELKANWSYEFPFNIRVGDRSLENLVLSSSHRYVFKQENILEEQDYVPPPDAYYVSDFKLATSIQYGRVRGRLIFKVENLFNAAFRDYLNQQRYFADDMGRNFTLGINLNW